MKLLVINNLASGYGEGAIYDFMRSFAADGDEICMRCTNGTTRVLQFDCIDPIAKPQVKRLFFCQIS